MRVVWYTTKTSKVTSADASAGFTTEEMAAYEKVKAAMEKEAEARGEKPAVPPKPDGLTDEEWARVQQKRTALRKITLDTT